MFESSPFLSNLAIAVAGLLIYAAFWVSSRKSGPHEQAAIRVGLGLLLVLPVVMAVLFGAYLHLLSDGLVSVGEVIAGALMQYTNWYWLDGAISLGILVVILISTWSLLTDSLRASMDAVPANVNVGNIENLVLKVKGVESVHHLHIWAMSTTQNALTAHLVLNDQLSFDEKMKLVQHIKHELQHNNIHHATIELESANLPCDDIDC